MAKPILGIIAPHPPIMVRAVGGARTSVTSASIEAMERAASALRRFAPDTLVVMSPHSPPLADAFVIDTTPHTSGTFAQFGAARTGVSAKTDTRFAERLLARLEADGIPAVDRASYPSLDPGTLDHGVLVPLSFLDPGGTIPLVDLSLSWLSLDHHRRLGGHVATAAAELGRRIVFLASGDLSHRLTRDAPAGYSERGAEFDRLVVELVSSGRLEDLAAIESALAESAGECGLRSFVTLSGVIPGAVGRVLSYEGPWGVGYLTALVGSAETLRAFGADAGTDGSSGSKGGAAGEPEHEIVRLARSVIEHAVEQGGESRPAPLTDPMLPGRAGVFVSLHLAGELRGCIGTIVPTKRTLADEVAHAAVQAATHDPRFPPVTREECGLLDIKVDVLHAPEPCEFADLDPASYGVVVSAGWRRGLLLPDLEGVDSAAQQVEIALRKAGIRPDEPYELERFRVDRYR